MADYIDRLNARVTALGTNASRLAAQIGIPQPTMHRYLTRGSSPKPEALGALAQALGVTVDWLLNGDESPDLPRVAEPIDDPLSRDIAKMNLLMTELDDDLRQAVIQLAINLREVRGQGKPLGRKKGG